MQQQPISADQWNRLCTLMNGWVFTQTLATACEVGLFDALDKYPGSTGEVLAKELSLDAHGTRVLLLACSALDVVERDGDGYRNSELAARFLVTDAPQSMASFAVYNQKIQQQGSTHFTAAVREGRAAGLDEFPGSGDTLYARLAERPALESLFQEAMGAYTRLSPRMLDVPQLDEVGTLVDVGGGDATNALRLCGRHPGLSVSLVDLPSVCGIAEERIAAAGMEQRIDCHPADMFEDPWPKGDAILMSHLVEIFDEERIMRLYDKAFAQLPPGGKLFIWTLTCDDDEAGGLQAAKSSIYFLTVASGQGMAYPARQHEHWLREAGFAEVERSDVRHLDHTLLVATRKAP
ncbi:methyltransferase [Streptomyces sp. 12297]|uniref:methyltransferase n=1 Tax=Streptomyces sp. NBC_00239 TaxID=2903640 RepID=UPI002E2882DC|nr:methyltransferase [Streptomyces sp. NBC_00239]